MHPDVIPGWPIHSYGLMLVIAFYSAYFLCRWTAKQEGIDPNRMVDILLLAAVFGIVGSRVLFVVQNLDNMHGILDYIAIWNGGLVFYGGLITATIGLMVYVFVKKIPMWRLADAVAPAVMIGLAFGRLGCFLNGCCWGGVCEPDYPLAVRFPRQITTVPADEVAKPVAERVSMVPNGEWVVLPNPDIPAWIYTREQLAAYVKDNPETWRKTSVTYARARTDEDGTSYVDRITRSYAYLQHLVQFPDKLGPQSEKSLHVHPTQLYSSFGGFTICGIVLLWRRIRRRPGEAFSVMLMCYAIARFTIEGLRNDTNPVLGGLTLSQATGIPIFLAGLTGFVLCRTRPVATERTEGAEADDKGEDDEPTASAA
jgi:phosphatidylglycerol:prolipoprotein diacylglycerol transferase